MKALAIKTSIAWFLAAVTLIVLIVGCRSVKTNKSVTIATHDSTATEKIDSAGIKKTNVVKLVTEDKDSKSVWEITWDTVAVIYSSLADSLIMKPAAVINSDGSITVNAKPKSIKKTVTDKGWLTISTVINRSDTASKTNEKKTAVNDTNTVQTVSKKKTGPATGFTISVIIFSLVILLYLLWRLKKHLAKPKAINESKN